MWFWSKPAGPGGEPVQCVSEDSQVDPEQYGALHLCPALSGFYFCFLCFFGLFPVVLVLIPDLPQPHCRWTPGWYKYTLLEPGVLGGNGFSWVQMCGGRGSCNPASIGCFSYKSSKLDLTSESSSFPPAIDPADGRCRPLFAAPRSHHPHSRSGHCDEARKHFGVRQTRDPPGAGRRHVRFLRQSWHVGSAGPLGRFACSCAALGQADRHLLMRSSCVSDQRSRTWISRLHLIWFGKCIAPWVFYFSETRNHLNKDFRVAF